MAKDHDNTVPQVIQPHNAQAEMAVLGAILFDNNAHQRATPHNDRPHGHNLPFQEGRLMITAR